MSACASCGTENAVGTAFCGNCGANLRSAVAVATAPAPPPPAGPAPAATCPICGTVNRSGGSFCGGCGSDLRVAMAVAAAAVVAAPVPTAVPPPASAPAPAEAAPSTSAPVDGSSTLAVRAAVVTGLALVAAGASALVVLSGLGQALPNLALLLLFAIYWCEARILAGRVVLPARHFLVFMVIGMVGAGTAAVGLERLATNWVSNATESHTVGPIIEEVLKATPVLLVAFLFRDARRLTVGDLALIGFAVGAGYGFLEASLRALAEGGIPAYVTSVLPQLPGERVEVTGGGLYAFGAGHAVWTGLVGLAIGVGTRIWPRRGYGSALGLVALVLVVFDHAMLNWKLVNPSGYPGIAYGWALDGLFYLTLIGLLPLLLFVAGLVWGSSVEARREAAVVADRPGLLLDGEQKPSVTGEWVAALRAVPQGLAGRLLAYYRRRRSFLLSVADGLEVDEEAMLRRRLVVGRAAPPRARSLGQWVSFGLAVLFIALFAVLYLVGVSRLPSSVRNLLNSSGFIVGLIVFAGLFTVYRIARFVTQPRPPEEDVEARIGFDAGAMALVSAVIGVAGAIAASFLPGEKLFSDPHNEYANNATKTFIKHGGHLQHPASSGAGASAGAGGHPGHNPDGSDHDEDDSKGGHHGGGHHGAPKPPKEHGGSGHQAGHPGKKPETIEVGAAPPGRLHVGIPIGSPHPGTPAGHPGSGGESGAGGHDSPGGGTPAHGGGTPAHGGGTPAHGGGTPAHGGGTPAHGGGTPAHGGGTPAPKPAHGGGGTPAPKPAHGGGGTPAPKPAHGGGGTPTPKPAHGGGGTPAPKPAHGGGGTPAPKPGHGGSGTPAPKPAHGGGTPAPRPTHGGGGTPAPKPAHGGGTPAPRPTHGGGTPAPPAAHGTGTPAPPAAHGTGTPAPPAAHGTGTPAPSEHVSGSPAPQEHLTGQPAPQEHLTGQPAPQEHLTAQPAPQEHLSGQPAPEENLSPPAAPAADSPEEGLTK